VCVCQGIENVISCKKCRIIKIPTAHWKSLLILKRRTNGLDVYKWYPKESILEMF